ncbi:hypothetical protein PSAL_020750 [Pseudooceanicola algae]|uniref:Uncharacterized protein n=2 Tax=Pseudooceanicola algae TaxID=1537215 RepID=A0A418SL80_9RHOB|nr:hypothetical protein PSAL_020750 [Pseudooceanicola algae]
MSQTLSPEEIAAMVDQKMRDMNPYQELLNNPDPARSLAAMEIMLGTGDESLVRMALEYGILSPNPTVKRVAFETYLQTGPIFSIRFDGSKVEDGDFPRIVRDLWNGTLDADMVGYWRIPVGQYYEVKRCYGVAGDSEENCFVTVNSDGIFLTPYYMNGRAIVADDGSLSGTANLQNVHEPLPFTISLID